MRHVLTEGISVGFLTSPVILALIIVKKYGLVEFVYFFGCLYDKILNINILEIYSQQFAIFFYADDQCDLRSFIIPWVYPTNSE